MTALMMNLRNQTGKKESFGRTSFLVIINHNFFNTIVTKFGFSEQQIAAWKDEPYFLTGNKNVGIVLLHGWSSIPTQVKPVARRLNKHGYSVSVPRLAGHGTKPEDLENATESDWINDLLEAVAELEKNPMITRIVVGGVSLGGNIAMLANNKINVHGYIFMGTPVLLKNHFGVWLGLKLLPLFKKYVKKDYPRGVAKDFISNTSYQYYPISSAAEAVKVIRHSLKKLRKIKKPVLILQTSRDYLVSKSSPWILYNSISSPEKKMQWIKTRHNGHVIDESDVDDSISIILNFLKKFEQ
jgi:carboxylesterase